MPGNEHPSARRNERAGTPFLIRRDELVQDVVERKKKLRDVLHLLYDDCGEARFLGAKVLGELARREPALIRKKWYRLFCAFDDTMCCWGVAECLGEIAREIPSLRGRIILLLKRFRDDPVTRQGYVWAVCRIGAVDPQRVGGMAAGLEEHLVSEDEDLLGQTIWALGELNQRHLRAGMMAHAEDVRMACIRDHEMVRSAPIADLVSEAVRKLRADRGEGKGEQTQPYRGEYDPG